MALEYLPISGAPSDNGPGRKMFFPIPLKNNPNSMEDFLYVFAESKLPFEPSDSDIGFTEEDIIDSTGIYLFNKKGDHARGKVFPMETLFVEVFTDLSLQNRITYQLTQMKRMVHLDDEFLDAANMDRAHHSRKDREELMRLN